MKRFAIALLWIAIFFAVIAGMQYFDGKKETLNQSATVFPIMSTQASLSFTDTNEEEIESAFKLARAAMEKVVATCNYFDPNSELGRLNASAASKPFHCSDALWEILMETRKFHALSGGAFDPTIRPLMKVWGFHRKRKTIPSDTEIADAKKISGFDKLLFDDTERTVAFRLPGVSIDLGGIAKGWAVDKAAEAVLKNTAVRIGVIDLGGNMRCLPEPPPGKTHYSIAVRDPKNTEKVCASLNILNECVATSGSYERYVTIGGKRYTHIINPVTGRPAEGVLSATIVTPRGVDSDALSTSLFINGASFAEKLGPDVRSLFISADGTFIERIPEGKEHFQLLSPLK